MNIDQAKRVPIADILAKLDIHPHKCGKGKQLYQSLFRKDKTPHFWNYTKANRWYDYSISRGGNSVDLVCTYLKYTKEDHTVADALRWLGNMFRESYEHSNHLLPQSNVSINTDLSLKKTTFIQHKGLNFYLKKHGIPLEVAQVHLKEVHVYDNFTNKSFYALGFRNEEGGYELRNPFFKGSQGALAISFIRGRDPHAKSVHVFQDFMDYLSAIAQLENHGFKGDTIVLNSLNCLKDALPYIDQYGYQSAYTWLNNDLEGERVTASLTEFIKTQADLIHICMNSVYAPHQNVSLWHMHQQNLRP